MLMFGAAAWYDHDSVFARARDTAIATTHALAEHGQAVMQTAALALDLQLQRVEEMDWADIGQSDPVHLFLVGLVKQLPQLQSAFFVDSQGFNSASSRDYPMHPYDDRDRPYFQAAANGQTGLTVSAPFRGRAAGTLGFVVSRARLKDGRFDGVAAVTLSPDYFRNFYESVLHWHEGATAALIRDDGTVLVRYPSDTRAAYVVPGQHPVMRALDQHATDGLREGRSSTDGREKLFAYRRVPQTDLVVIYALDRQQILAEWYQHLGIFAAFAVLTCVVLLLAARRAILHAAREQQALQTLLDESNRRERAELALQQATKLEALGRLTGGVAHDFNNLLAAVLGSIELALRRVHDARVIRQLAVAQQAAKRGARLTAQMLAFARKQAIELRPIDANASIHDSDELLRRACGGIITIRYDLESGLWCALADPIQLELALLNLVTNARDAMPGGGEVTLRTRNLPWGAALPDVVTGRDYVLIAVQDSGAGMTEDVRRNAFEPFFTTKGPGQGTGLGLSSVYGFARQLGGTVTIDSTPGQGTTVSLYLPRTSAEAANAGPRTPDNAVRLRILLVDDDAAVRASACEMLAELGHVVTEASGGEQALELLDRQRFEVLMADFAMPGMNGTELAERTKRLLPDLPIIFMTGYVDQEALRGWIARGCSVVEKPFDLARLAAALQRATQVTPAV